MPYLIDLKLDFLYSSPPSVRGKGGITHYPPLELKDLHRLYEYLHSNNNVKLQEKVFLDLMLYFGRRGRENIHDLKITDFAVIF
jgi:hypothetical protein